MAERRMFSKRIVRSAKFLKMPVSSRELYWQLGVEADDDGIVESFNVMRMTGATEDDLRVLVSKGFVQVLNEDLVAYITDWHENNKLRADRKVDSIYKDLLIQINPDVKLIEPKPRADTKKLTGQQDDVQWTSNGQPMDCIGKDSIGKSSIGKKSITKVKHKYGEYQNVKLTEKEYNSLISEYGSSTDEIITYLDEYIEMKGTKYKSCYLAIRKWVAKAVLEKKNTVSNVSTVRKEIKPDWLGKEIEDEPMTEEELEEARKLQERLKAYYGKRRD